MEATELAKIREFFRGDRYAVLSGFVIESVEGDTATCSFEIQDFHLNAVNTVMGGATFALADFAFAVACNAAYLRGTGAMTMAASNNIQYLRSPGGGKLTARAVPLQCGRRMCFYRVEVTDGQGNLVAEMTCTGCRKQTLEKGL